MITIDRDYKSGTGDKYMVKAVDSGFGSWKVRHLSIEAAFETVKHYYGLNHDKTICGNCSKMIVESPKRRSVLNRKRIITLT